jgi:hypothetical protein
VNLTEHFTLEELTVTSHRQFDNTPKANELANLMRVAALLEQVKIVLGGKPIMINSGFRSKQVNDAVGSKDTSQHRIGCAADIRVPGMTPKQVVQACIDADIPYDQVIEEFASWTHISVPNTVSTAPRKQALIIDKAGTRPFK